MGSRGGVGIQENGEGVGIPEDGEGVRIHRRVGIGRVSRSEGREWGSRRVGI